MGTYMRPTQQCEWLSQISSDMERARSGCDSWASFWVIGAAHMSCQAVTVLTIDSFNPSSSRRFRFLIDIATTAAPLVHVKRF